MQTTRSEMTLACYAESKPQIRPGRNSRSRCRIRAPMKTWRRQFCLCLFVNFLVRATSRHGLSLVVIEQENEPTGPKTQEPWFKSLWSKEVILFH